MTNLSIHGMEPPTIHILCMPYIPHILVGGFNHLETHESQYENGVSLLKMVDWWISKNFQWEFEDPKMEVLYHIKPYFVG